MREEGELAKEKMEGEWRRHMRAFLLILQTGELSCWHILEMFWFILSQKNIFTKKRLTFRCVAFAFIVTLDADTVLASLK